MEDIDAPLPPSALQVDFSWKKFRGRVNDPAHRNSMIVHCNLTKPHLEFRTTSDEPIGTGSVHYLKIDSDAEIRGVPIHIEPLKRFTTGYTHPSRAYAKGTGKTTMAMTWTSGTNFKQWDFVCLDDDHQPVARFSSNVWAIRKLGLIEFTGDKANDPVAREEIVIVGLTIYYTMLMRFENPLQLFGAVFSKPGYPKNESDRGHELPEYEATTSGRELDARNASAQRTNLDVSSRKKSVDR